MFLPSAKVIWDTLQQNYFLKQDMAVVYELQTKISSTKQGSMSMQDYYNLMNRLWLEMGHYQDLKMKYSDNVEILLEFVEQDRIFFIFS